ncbi:MAG: flagellar hook-basal body complex protein [Clostridiaceae bacterium]|nr:flagellar hook-basal body complex protein [Clostridiaceae bacterium]
MIRSMFSAVTGLKNHQTMMDVIGNNIANVNTAGYKSSRVLFRDLYYQTVSDASGASENMGGKNATQIGYGATVGSVQVLNSRSGYQQTGRTRDQYIAGEGYFIANDPTGDLLYTRVGALDFDTKGNLIDSNGNFVMGVSGEAAGESIDKGDLKKITIEDYEKYTDIAIASDGTITGKNTETSEVKTLGQIVIAVFNNPSGLSEKGSLYYGETANSGEASYVKAGGGLAGALVSGGLEMSNVDLSKEFTDMIVAQRGFQANSRVITTSDQILEELVNLKR